jgi:antirestriction protein
METKTTFEDVMSEAPAGFQDMEQVAQAYWDNDAYWCESLDPSEFWDKFEDAFAGVWDSEMDFTEQLVEDTGFLDVMPEHLISYFDYEAYRRDLFMCDYWSATVTGYAVAVFRSY